MLSKQTVDELLKLPFEELTADRERFITLCALSPELFGRTFFPSSMKHASPPFHYDIWNALMSPSRYVAMKCFRGSAKTTLTRLATAARIALGISRFCLATSASQTQASHTVQWLQQQIENNRRFASFFGLSKGRKWSEDDIEIRHEVCGHTVRVMAVGLTGQLRGLNVNDARPDFIIADDPQDDETAATEAQRRKLEERFFGALAKSLTPATECPEAKIALLQTPLHRDDLISKCERDSAWRTATYGCFYTDEHGQLQSRWPDRFPLETLLQEKASHADRNILHVWLREMECKVVDESTAAFKRDWLKFYSAPPTDCATIIAVDPAISDGRDADYTAIVVLGVNRDGLFILDYTLERGLTPTRTISYIFSYISRYRPVKIAVEAIAYQRALAILLREEMEKRREFVPIEEIRDRRPKHLRIVQAISGAAYGGRLYCSKMHSEFITDYSDYPEVSHDDLLDAVAMAIMAAPKHLTGGSLLDTQEYGSPEDYDKIIELGTWRAAV